MRTEAIEAEQGRKLGRRIKGGKEAYKRRRKKENYNNWTAEKKEGNIKVKDYLRSIKWAGLGTVKGALRESKAYRRQCETFLCIKASFWCIFPKKMLYEAQHPEYRRQ